MKKRIPFLIVIAVIILHAVCNYIWLKMDGRPLWFDFGHYFNRSIYLHRAAGEGFGNFLQALLGQAPDIHVVHPHRVVTALASLPFYYFFGISEDVAVMSLVTFFAILVLSVYGIVKEIIGARAGAFAAFLVFTLPGVSWLSRHYSPEFVTSGLVALFMYLLIKSDNFQKKRYSAALGITAGLGLLTKGTYFIFMIGPVFYAFFDIVITKEKRWARIASFFMFTVLCFLIVAPWFIPNLESIFSLIKDVPFSNDIVELYGMPSCLTLKGALFYMVSAINWGTSFIYFMFFIPGCFCFIKYMGSQPGDHLRRIKYIILTWIFVPYIVFTLIPSKCEEYFNPFYPAVAIVIAVMVFSIKKVFLRRFLMVFIAVMGSLIFFYRSYGTVVFLPKILPVRVLGLDLFIFNQQGEPLPVKGDWRLKEILQFTDSYEKELPSGRDEYYLCVLPDTAELSTPVIRYYTNWLRLPFFVFGVQSSDEETLEGILNSDLIIDRTGYQGLFLAEEDRKKIIERIEQSGQFIKLPKEFTLPDDTVVSVYLNLWRKT